MERQLAVFFHGKQAAGFYQQRDAVLVGFQVNLPRAIQERVVPEAVPAPFGQYQRAADGAFFEDGRYQEGISQEKGIVDVEQGGIFRWMPLALRSRARPARSGNRFGSTVKMR